MVRLKELPRTHIEQIHSAFNSTMVRLKANGTLEGTTEWFSFNSTMVRLKVLRCVRAVIRIIIFQFHYGTIKR